MVETDDIPCDDVVEVMTDYLEGALPPDEVRRLERHFEMCPGCDEYVAQMRAIAGSLGGVTDAAIPDEMRERLLAAFREETSRRDP